MTLKVTSLSLENHGYSSAKGRIHLAGEDGSGHSFKLSEDECQELLARGIEMFQARQHTFAKAIADYQPSMLISPEDPEADFEPVDIPF